MIYILSGRIERQRNIAENVGARQIKLTLQYCAAQAPAFRALVERWMEQASASSEALTMYIVDVSPIMLGHRRYSGYAKVTGVCAQKLQFRKKETILRCKTSRFYTEAQSETACPGGPAYILHNGILLEYLCLRCSRDVYHFI